MCGFGVVMSHTQRGYIDKAQVFLNGFTNDEYLDFIENVLCELPNTFEDRFYLTQGTTWVNNQLLIAESRMYQVTLSDFDKYFVINIIAKQNSSLTELAVFSLENVSSNILDDISKYYDVWSKVSFRTSLRRLIPSKFNKPPKVDIDRTL